MLLERPSPGEMKSISKPKVSFPKLAESTTPSPPNIDLSVPLASTPPVRLTPELISIFPCTISVVLIPSTVLLSPIVSRPLPDLVKE